MKSRVLSFFMVAGLAGSVVFGVTSCSEEEKLPAIGGFNTADEVAATNLVAHWAFEGDGKEHKSGAAPSSSINATYGTGAKGKAVNFAAGYLAYNEIAALKSLPNMTVSMWAKVDNNGSTPTNLFQMTRANEWAGNINFLLETGWKKPGADTLIVKGLVVTNKDGNPSWQDSRNEPSKGGVQAPKGVNKWTHLVITWDGASSNFKTYANGVKVSNPEWEVRGTTGPLNFYSPTKPLIGAFGTNVPGGGTAESWQKPMTGGVDELRVFNKALTDAEISALYQLELAGR
jgi:hypothetical protein